MIAFDYDRQVWVDGESARVWRSTIHGCQGCSRATDSSPTRFLEGINAWLGNITEMKTFTSILLGISLHVAPGQAATTGLASWYGSECAGRLMANGKPFRPEALTCASYQFNLGDRLRVTANGRSVICVVSDRGPARHLGREIDLSKAAFECLAPLGAGLVTVKIEKIP